MAETPLETARLVLRRPEPADLSWQQQWLNTPDVMRHLGGVQPAEQLASAFAANAAAMAEGKPGFWTVALKDTGQPIGKCGLAPIGTPHAPALLSGALQVGWTLAAPFWGMGYASEAARAALDHGFTNLGADTIWAQTSDSNQASTRMMARLGLRRRPDLDYIDPEYPPADNPTTIYQMLRARWLDTNGRPTASQEEV